MKTIFIVNPIDRAADGFACKIEYEGSWTTVRLGFVKLPIPEFKHNLKKIAIDKNSYQEEFQNNYGQRRVEDSAVLKMGVYLDVTP
jgi:hypothetical protein